MKTEEKKKAITLRESGLSLNEIVRDLKVAKSSVSLWVRDVKLTPTQLGVLNSKGFSVGVIENRRETRLLNEKNKRQAVMEKAGEDFKLLSKSDLKVIGCMLYWAEGGKTQRGSVRFANSDPAMIKIMMRFFREICKVPESRFRGHIHTFSHLNRIHAEKYWASISQISRSQFFRTYVKKSIASQNKKDSLPFGTFDIYVCDTNLFLTIMGWIAKIKNLLI